MHRRARVGQSVGAPLGSDGSFRGTSGTAYRGPFAVRTSELVPNGFMVRDVMKTVKCAREGVEELAELTEAFT